MSLKVKWEVDDGYMSGGRPQSSTVDLDDFQHCESEEEVRQILAEIIQDEFAQKISWFMKNEDEAVAAIMLAKKTEAVGEVK